LLFFFPSFSFIINFLEVSSPLSADDSEVSSSLVSFFFCRPSSLLLAGGFFFSGYLLPFFGLIIWSLIALF